MSHKNFRATLFRPGRDGENFYGEFHLTKTIKNITR